MSSDELVTMLVGSHHRPPAKQVLAALPSGARLVLAPEPENAYDPKAIRVLVDVNAALPHSQYEALGAALEGTGVDVMDLLQSGELFHLGYVANSDNEKTSAGLGGNREVGAMLASGDVVAALIFDPNGRAQVRVRLVPDGLADGSGPEEFDEEGEDWPDGEDEE